MGRMGRQLQLVKTFLTEPPPRAAPPSPIFDRFCIAFLVIDWIVFGSMHFSLHDGTRRMLPPWVPFSDAVVVSTGFAEVTIGMLMLYSRARRIAAAGSLMLLILFIPAVFHILSDEGSLPYAPDSVPARLWRLLGIPHNVLMAICSLHILRKPYPDLWGDFEPRPPSTTTSSPPSSGGVSRFLAVEAGAVLIVAFILLACNAAGFIAVLFGVHGDIPTATMWMMMCLAVGGLLGFLFAVPRTNTKTPGHGILRPNRNIEAISDWLTKILVGLGLVNFKDIGAFLGERSAILAPLLKVDPNYALALIIYFLVSGFLEGYLLTRMFLQRHFEDVADTKISARRLVRNS
jgi:uncharacterized membrane protein